MKHPIRSMFIPSLNSQFLAMDLSQAETWVVAFTARERSMKDALQNSDIHKLTASVLFERDTITKEERYIGKRCNHALSYRMSPNRLFQVFNKDAQLSGVSITLQQAKAFHIRWHSFYKILGWWSEIEGELNKARTLTTIYGRSRTFYGRWGDEMFKEATAFIPQSTVADHALGATQPELGITGGLVGIWKWCQRNKDCRIVHTAHDSVMLEIPLNREKEVAEEILPLFARPMIINGEQFTIPVEVEHGERWGELNKC
jgi:DNA polymerase I-like protein with 3'-5' exonuclease and polymerase domains